MPLLTTTIGSYPKPPYVPVPDWFQEESTTIKDPTKAYEAYLQNRQDEVEELLDRATREVVEDQAADEERGEHRCDDADHQCHGEAADWANADVEQHDACEEGAECR